MTAQTTDAPAEHIGRHRIENGGTLPWALIDRIRRERNRVTLIAPISPKARKPRAR